MRRPIPRAAIARCIWASSRRTTRPTSAARRSTRPRRASIRSCCHEQPVFRRPPPSSQRVLLFLVHLPAHTHCLANGLIRSAAVPHDAGVRLPQPRRDTIARATSIPVNLALDTRHRHRDHWHRSRLRRHHRNRQRRHGARRRHHQRHGHPGAPRQPIPPGASAIHYIIDEDLKDAPPLRMVIDRFKARELTGRGQRVEAARGSRSPHRTRSRDRRRIRDGRAGARMGGPSFSPVVAMKPDTACAMKSNDGRSTATARVDSSAPTHRQALTVGLVPQEVTNSRLRRSRGATS